MKTQLFRLPAAVRRDPAIEDWFRRQSPGLRDLARQWFEIMRECGADVREILHDGHPTACVTDAAFGYVNAFTAHVNVGFFRGADLPDPAGLLQGTGKFMRHVKLNPESPLPDPAALRELILAAYQDLQRRVAEEAESSSRQ